MNDLIDKQVDKDTGEGYWSDIGTRLIPLKLFEIDYKSPDTHSETGQTVHGLNVEIGK